MSDQDNTVVLGSGAIGAGTNYSISGAGVDTITIDPASWSLNSATVHNGGYTISNVGTSYNWTQPYPTVRIDTDGLTMEKGADIKIAGKSLTEAIEKIEERLGILNPNPELEGRWETLKDLRRQYIEMERDILEKEKIMKILKEK